ncbi:hypothetical protein MACK_002341 [Theileria orientalis]|uniref:Uncharacterized protein n=1 Tax=Theileria orientalis TaxID=68886 RepID=A0A976MC45_THEOR|nr:hypothetical protein MACK_002341 [Theileria orientalis]
MVDIDLFNKDEQETKNDYEVTVNKSDFADHFHKVKYDIKFKKPFEYSIRTWLTGPKPYNINIKFRNRNPFSYHVVVEHQIVREVETYFSNHNPNVPLIIGFKPDNSEFEYYTFLSLTGKGWSYGLPSDIGFGTNDLVQRLKQENEKRNKIKYITERGNSQKYYITDSLVQGVRKYTFTAKDDESSQDHQIETNHLLSKGLLDRTIIEKMLYEMKDKTFNSINVYSSIRSNVAILFEFVSETIKVRFERKDNDGYYWMKNISTYDYRYDQGTDVKKIESEYEKRITYQLDKNSNINSGYKKIIEVTEVLKTNSFTAYTHRPKNLESIALTYVLYNDKAITIVANENITSSQGKLEQKNIQISNFKEISTYVLNDRANEHLLIKITKDRVNYYFSRFSKAGTKWRQVCLEELRDSGIDTSSVNQLHVFDKKLESLLNGDSGHGNVEKLLIFIRFEINSIVVLLNKKIMYCKPDIQEVVGTNSKEKHVPPIDIDTNTIEVSDETDTKGNCVKEKRYYLYQHNITEAASKGLGKPGDVTLFLRFYLDKNLIHLYENLNKIEIPTYLTYSPGINDLYVYFYGDRSIRPLLLCYNGKSFKSNDKDSYYTKWILDNDVKDCVCKQDSSKLIKALNKTKFSNVIYLYEQIGSGFEYPGSKLFTWYNHQQEGSKKGDIDLYKGRQETKQGEKSTDIYNAGKINIKLHQKGPPDLSSSRFMRYKHTPQHQHGTKKSCVIFKNNVLLCWRHSKAETIDQIQGQLLISVDVYFSNNRVEEPFLAAFEIGGSSELF